MDGWMDEKWMDAVDGSVDDHWKEGELGCWMDGCLDQ